MRSGIPLPFHKLYCRKVFSTLPPSRGLDRLMSVGTIVRISLGKHDLHFRHGNHRQVANEKQKERSKNSQRADKRPDINPRRKKQSPGRGQKITVQTAHDNDEALEPHPGVDAHANEVNDENVATTPAEPKKLG